MLSVCSPHSDSREDQKITNIYAGGNSSFAACSSDEVTVQPHKLWFMFSQTKHQLLHVSLTGSRWSPERCRAELARVFNWQMGLRMRLKVTEEDKTVSGCFIFIIMNPKLLTRFSFIYYYLNSPQGNWPNLLLCVVCERKLRGQKVKWRFWARSSAWSL